MIIDKELRKFKVYYYQITTWERQATKAFARCRCVGDGGEGDDEGDNVGDVESSRAELHLMAMPSFFSSNVNMYKQIPDP